MIMMVLTFPDGFRSIWYPNSSDRDGIHFFFHVEWEKFVARCTERVDMELAEKIMALSLITPYG